MQNSADCSRAGNSVRGLYNILDRDKVLTASKSSEVAVGSSEEARPSVVAAHESSEEGLKVK